MYQKVSLSCRESKVLDNSLFTIFLVPKEILQALGELQFIQNNQRWLPAAP